MAVTNAEISKIEQVETQGSTGDAGTLITSAILYITPAEGYSIRKEDIAVGTLPAGVSSVTLTNTGTPYTAGNTVKVTIALDPSYAMPSSDTTISIPITGDAYFGVKEYVGYHFKIRSNTTIPSGLGLRPLENAFTPSSTALGSDAFGNLNTVTTVQTRDDVVMSFSGFVERDVSTVVGQYTVVAKEFHHISNYRLGFFGKLFLKPKSQVLNSDNLHTTIVYDVVYKNDRVVEEAACIDTTIDIAVEQDISQELLISFMDAGDKLVNPAGETRKMYVYGNPGAIFSLSITSDTGVEIKKLTNVEIENVYRESTSGRGSVGRYECIVEFPATAINVNWNVILSSGTNLMQPMVPDTIETYVLNQYTPSTISITNTATNGNIVRTAAPSIIYKSKADVDVETLYRSRDKPGEYNGMKFTTPIAWTLTNAVGQTYTVDKANPVLSDFSNVDSKTNGGTIVRAPSPFTVTGGGTGTVVIKGVLEISHVGKDDVTINMDLDNIVTLS